MGVLLFFLVTFAQRGKCALRWRVRHHLTGEPLHAADHFVGITVWESWLERALHRQMPSLLTHVPSVTIQIGPGMLLPHLT